MQEKFKVYGEMIVCSTYLQPTVYRSVHTIIPDQILSPQISTLTGHVTLLMT